VAELVCADVSGAEHAHAPAGPRDRRAGARFDRRDRDLGFEPGGGRSASSSSRVPYRLVPSIAPAGRVDVLLVSAHAPDLRGFRAALGERFDADVRGVHVTAKVVGVGLVAAGTSAAKRVFQLDPMAVVHVGTCALYPGSDHAPGDVLVAERIDLVDHAVASGVASFPDPMQLSVSTTQMLTRGIAAARARVQTIALASCLADSIDERITLERKTQLGVMAENLEAFAIAHACRLAEVPFTSVVAPTHVTGPNGRAERQTFERQATLAVAEVVLNWLSTGAQGMPHG
jgi:nucleoside phosphorylase